MQISESKNQYVTMLIVFSIIYAIFAIVTYKDIVAGNNGQFTYAMDDAYIHMTIAKNLASEGMWSANNSTFTSSSSSPLWSGVIAFGFVLIGVSEYMPFILASLSGIAVIASTVWIAKKYSLNDIYTFFLTASVCLLSQIVFLTFTGLEHLLHIAISIVFVGFAIDTVIATEVSRRNVVVLSILAGILVATRLESIFFIGIVCVMLLAQKRYGASITLAASSTISVVIMGTVSLKNGWYFLPNSVLLKSGTVSGGFMFKIQTIIAQILSLEQGVYALIFLVVCVGGLLWINGDMSDKKEKMLAYIFLVTTGLHVLFARFGWQYRYEAYLVVIGLIVFFVLLRRLITVHGLTKIERSKYILPVIFFFAISVALLLERVTYGLVASRHGAHEIYLQQFQMATFIEKYYSEQLVAINDIGAVGYYTNASVVDLWGLADLNIGSFRLNGEYTRNNLAAVTKDRDVPIVAIYKSWFVYPKESRKSIGIPEEWIEVGAWSIAENFVVAHETVTFYAVDQKYANDLKANLLEFSEVLPEDVSVEMYD